MKIHQTELEIVRGSVLEQNVAVIVNAANTGMRGGGALDRVIHRAAGREMLRELEHFAPNGSQTAEVVVTKGHKLSQAFVFHVAGPIWHEKRAEECDQLLAASYRNCLEEAQKRELETLAFPSLSTGVYSFPLERAAPIALAAAVEFLRENPETALRRVVFALFGADEFHHFRQALRKYANP